MTLANTRKFTELGLAPELAKAVSDAIDAAASGVTVAWGDVTGTQDGVEVAVAAKTEIAALTGSSTAADIVTALQA